MNEAMKVSNVQEYFNELDINIKNNVIYAQIDAKAWKYLAFSGFATLSIQHFLLCFEKDRVVVAGVTTMGGFTKQNEVIKKDRIQSISYKKGLIQGKLIITIENDEYIFIVPKTILVAPWHKENLRVLLEKNFN